MTNISEMMKFSFITTMSGWQWGGSEELWFDTALYAAKKGNKVNAFVYDWIKDHSKVAELKNNNVNVFFRPRYRSFTERIVNRLPLFLSNVLSSRPYWQKHLPLRNNFIVISQGNSFDILYSESLCDFLLKNNIDFVLLCQFNYEHHTLSMEDIQVARRLYQKAKKVYFVSQRNMNVAERQLACSIENSEIVFNPVKVRSNKPLPFPKDQSQLKMACVARFDCNFKGQDILLELLSSDKWREREFVLNLYGKGRDENYIKALIQFYGLGHKVIIRGHVEDVRKIWEENVLIVLPSFGEGTPLSLIEAMACGRPAVVTDVGGNVDWIKDGYNGFIADFPQIKALDKAMEEMWKNKNDLQFFGKNAFEYYKDNFPDDPVQFFFESLLRGSQP